MCRHCLHGLQHSSPAHLLLLLSNQVRRITRRRLTSHVSRLTMRHWKILLCFYFSLRLVWVSSWWIKNKTKRITLPFSVTTSLSLHAWEQFIILFYFPLEWLLYPSERTQGPNLFIYWRRPLGWNLEWRGFSQYGPVLDLRKRSIVFVEIISLDEGKIKTTDV